MCQASAPSGTACCADSDCPADTYGAWGSNYCKNGNVYHQRSFYNYYCTANHSCTYSTTSQEALVQTCTSGCTNGVCNSCTPQASSACDVASQDIYYYDSCGGKGALKDDCSSHDSSSTGSIFCDAASGDLMTTTTTTHYGCTAGAASCSVTSTTSTNQVSTSCENGCSATTNQCNPNCQNDAACTSAASTGCSADSVNRWYCADTDADGCLEQTWAACTGQRCSNGVCVAGCVNDMSCDDNNPCTADSCSATYQCTHTFLMGQSCTATGQVSGICDASGSCVACTTTICDGVCCAAGQSCVNGVCTNPCTDACTAGATQCSGTSVLTCQVADTGCTAWVTTSCSGGKSCTNGVCACLSGKTDCDGLCVDTNTDPNNCKTCGTACVDDKVCIGGVCKIQECTTNTQCVQACKTGTCSGGTCGSYQDKDDGTSCTGGHCVDGSCTADCANPYFCATTPPSNAILNDDYYCSDGGCYGCESGYTKCSASCVDIKTDEENCGACNRACPSTAPTCSNGKCVACTTMNDCDDNNVCTTDACTSDGCTHTNNNNSCTIGMKPGTCSQGVCVATPECTAGTRRCISGSTQVCVAGFWSTPTRCPGNMACADSTSCMPVACDENSDCDDNNACTMDTCGCDDGLCLDPYKCLFTPVIDGMRCANGVCSNGVCTPLCNEPERASCDGNRWLVTRCGVIVRSGTCTPNQHCLLTDQGATCVLTQQCDAYPGTVNCNGVCVDTKSSHDNCGLCNNPCTDTQACRDGECEAIENCHVICTETRGCDEDELCLHPGDCFESVCVPKRVQQDPTLLEQLTDYIRITAYIDNGAFKFRVTNLCDNPLENVTFDAGFAKAAIDHVEQLQIQTATPTTLAPNKVRLSLGTLDSSAIVIVTPSRANLSYLTISNIQYAGSCNPQPTDLVAITPSLTRHGNTTNITLALDPARSLEGLRIPVEIPKCLAENVAELKLSGEYEVIKDDPLIVWSFDEISRPDSISFAVDRDVTQECLDQLKALAYAQKIGSPLSPWLAILLIPVIGFVLVFFQRFTKPAVRERLTKKEFVAIAKQQGLDDEEVERHWQDYQRRF